MCLVTECRVGADDGAGPGWGRGEAGGRAGIEAQLGEGFGLKTQLQPQVSHPAKLSP